MVQSTLHVVFETLHTLSKNFIFSDLWLIEDVMVFIFKAIYVSQQAADDQGTI